VLDKLGCRGTITGELCSTNVRVPAENLLGEEVNKGAEYLTKYWMRSGHDRGMALGIARAAYAEGLEYARKRLRW